MKKYLLTFCSSNYSNERINKNIVPNEAKSLDVFDEIISLDEYNLDKYIYNIIQERIKKYGYRLYGYSSWRPYIILKYLNQINDGDILVYMDSDFISLSENKSHKQELFKDIFNKLEKNDIGIIAHFGEVSTDLLFTTTKLRKCIEKYLNYNFTFNQLNNLQYASGIIYIKKCKNSINIINLWNEILQNNFDLVTDAYNNDPDNYEGFIENRHEQSIWSLICKYYNIENDEIDIYGEFMNYKYNYKQYL